MLHGAAVAERRRPADAPPVENLDVGGQHPHRGWQLPAERLLNALRVLARGQPDPALADFHRSLALEPDHRGVLLDTAEAYRRLDRPQRALATLAVLGETYGPNETPASVLVLEGLAQEALGRPADAAESYRRALIGDDPPPEAAARLAALEQSAGPVIAREPTPPLH